MLSVDNEIYSISSVAIVWAIAGITALLGYHLLRFLYRKIRRQQAIKAQEKIVRITKHDAQKIIKDALDKIESIFSQAQSNQINISDAAENVSALSREVFDTLMNHRTRYYSKHESVKRNLMNIVSSQDIAYPLEFSDAPKNLTELRKFCDKSKEIISSCI